MHQQLLTYKRLRKQDCVLFRRYLEGIDIEISNIEILIRRMLLAYRDGVFGVIGAIRICLRFIP